jgi:hypothetical protein
MLAPLRKCADAAHDPGEEACREQISDIVAGGPCGRDDNSRCKRTAPRPRRRPKHHGLPRLSAASSGIAAAIVAAVPRYAATQVAASPWRCASPRLGAVKRGCQNPPTVNATSSAPPGDPSKVNLFPIRAHEIDLRWPRRETLRTATSSICSRRCSTTSSTRSAASRNCLPRPRSSSHGMRAAASMIRVSFSRSTSSVTARACPCW